MIRSEGRRAGRHHPGRRRSRTTRERRLVWRWAGLRYRPDV